MPGWVSRFNGRSMAGSMLTKPDPDRHRRRYPPSFNGRSMAGSMLTRSGDGAAE